MTVTIRPTTQADVEEHSGRLPPWRIRALTVRDGDRILGIGGITFLPDGAIAAFINCSEEDAKAYPVSLMKAARQVLEFARETGQPHVVAQVDRSRAAADRFLIRLGFAPVPLIQDENQTVYVRVFDGTGDDRRPGIGRDRHDRADGSGQPAG